LRAISTDSFTTLKKASRLPATAQAVLEILSVLAEHPKKKGRKDDAFYKKLLEDEEFIKLVNKIDPSQITKDQTKKIDDTVTKKDFSPAELIKSSPTLSALCKAFKHLVEPPKKSADSTPKANTAKTTAPKTTAPKPTTTTNTTKPPSTPKNTTNKATEDKKPATKPAEEKKTPATKPAEEKKTTTPKPSTEKKPDAKKVDPEVVEKIENKIKETENAFAKEVLSGLEGCYKNAVNETINKSGSPSGDTFNYLKALNVLLNNSTKEVEVWADVKKGLGSDLVPKVMEYDLKTVSDKAIAIVKKKLALEKLNVETTIKKNGLAGNLLKIVKGIIDFHVEEVKNKKKAAEEKKQEEKAAEEKIEKPAESTEKTEEKIEKPAEQTEEKKPEQVQEEAKPEV